VHPWLLLLTLVFPLSSDGGALKETPPEPASAEPALPATGEGASTPEGAALTPEQVSAALAVAGLEFTEDEINQLLPGALENLRNYEELRRRSLPNELIPALGFTPRLPGVRGVTPSVAGSPVPLPEVARPADLRELHFADILTLASLIRRREVSCVELTELFIARLRALDPTLHCVISFTEERALARARDLDAELDEGRWRGPLHGIPYGAKDLFSVRGTRTTWGARPFVEQEIDVDATVIERLDEAGAILIAKLTLGALAMGDIWYGGKTRNPWNPEQGSSGSSAGSASAVAAGGVPFALGTETLGSIVSPSRRCGNSSIRPTFGRVSRHGAMALCWTMDKIGPMARTIHDASLVLSAIAGPDGKDPTVSATPCPPAVEMEPKGVRVGVPVGAFRDGMPHASVLEELESLGVELVEIELPDFPVWEMMVILHAEAAAAFDELTRSDLDDTLTEQGPQAWPNLFRVARLIPAVEYIRANRLRTALCREMDQVLAGVDLLVVPGGEGRSLGITNLTGHPCAVAPCGFREDGRPYSATFIGHLEDEARLASFVAAWQRSTEYHWRHPKL